MSKPKSFSITTIVKRNGTIVPFKTDKITSAIEKAMRASGEYKDGAPDMVAQSVMQALVREKAINKKFKPRRSERRGYSFLHRKIGGNICQYHKLGGLHTHFSLCAGHAKVQRHPNNLGWRNPRNAISFTILTIHDDFKK